MNDAILRSEPIPLPFPLPTIGDSNRSRPRYDMMKNDGRFWYSGESHYIYARDSRSSTLRRLIDLPDHCQCCCCFTKEIVDRATNEIESISYLISVCFVFEQIHPESPAFESIVVEFLSSCGACFQ